MVIKQITAAGGWFGINALLQAFLTAGPEFEIDVLIGTIEGGPPGHHIVFTIGEVTSVMTIAQADRLVDMLINQAGGFSPGLQDDFAKLGKLMQSILAAAPGVHGVH